MKQIIFIGTVLLLMLSVTAYSPPDKDNVIIQIGPTYTAPDKDNVVIQLGDPTGPSDSCTYSGSGDWLVNCADNCTISTETDLGGNSIVIAGEGTFTTTANIINYNNIKIVGDGQSNQCAVKCVGGCFLD